MNPHVLATFSKPGKGAAFRVVRTVSGTLVLEECNGIDAMGALSWTRRLSSDPVALALLFSLCETLRDTADAALTDAEYRAASRTK